MRGIARRTVRGLTALTAAVALVLPLSACGGEGLVSNVAAFGAQGTGEGSYEITARIPSAAGLVRNARVMMYDSTVGSVGRVSVDDWAAEITIRLNGDVKVPKGSHAMIGMTSVLGSSHLALVPPAEPTGAFVEPGGALALPDCPEQTNLAQPQGKPVPDINLAQTVDPCRYPTTEQVLSSLSVVLNGGGLSQMGEVVDELSTAFGGRGEELSSLIPRLNTLVTDLEKQTGNIIAATEGLDRLSASINAQSSTVQRALASGPQILQLLKDQEQNLVTALGRVGDLSSTANEILRRNGDDFRVIAPNMRALMDQLANTGPALMNSLRILLTFPFIQESIGTVVKGDYVNSDLVLDLTFDRINETMMTSLALTGPEGLLGAAAGNARKSADPLIAPFLPDWNRPQAAPAPKKPGAGTQKSQPQKSQKSQPKKPATTTRGGN
ncbi:Mce family protein [Gordonia hirsuta DSM 44140 = NBRC 16056]|uniref:Mce family protein n=1 Tax=Gordonia hirsuta DSM 44140 = NBRC 16056 TaxID=1121927 RepID=L7LCW2_9ACTN|nr:MCE family protein [Gordonia hirsuta]GAC57883.1 Mce family protein [Gordonia hirsuta DSM 44140 = NBRC 16056]